MTWRVCLKVFNLSTVLQGPGLIVNSVTAVGMRGPFLAIVQNASDSVSYLHFDEKLTDLNLSLGVPDGFHSGHNHRSSRIPPLLAWKIGCSQCCELRFYSKQFPCLLVPSDETDKDLVPSPPANQNGQIHNRSYR